MSRLYIIGNGFDVAHGIPSKYSDFCKYMCLYHHKDFHELGELYNYNNPSILWCDFENRLGCPDICSDVQRRMSFWKRQNNNNGFQQEIEMGNDCDDKVVNLVQYFQDWITDTLSTISCEPKYELNKCDYYLSFNYTSLLEDVYKIPSTHVYHIHHLLKSLSHANEIDFYGFSFSDADRPYFDNFFKMALDGQNTVGEKRKIKIYTKDEDSGKGISDNIQEMTGGNSSFFDMYDLTLCYSNGQSEHVC